MTFYTLGPTEHDDRSSETLCERHALEQTQQALDIAHVGEEFTDMREATLILTALIAVAGFDLGMRSTEEGECDLCRSEAA